MKLLKTHPLLRFLNSFLVDSPQPANLSYLWNFGSLLATCLGIQILSGAFLAMHYQAHVDFAFNSVEHIMRDVNNGWIIRYMHANVASFFFIFVYGHIARGLYYNSYKTPRVLLWSIGVIILILMIAIAFLGYVLPFGQMSLWGATVITNLLSAIPVFGHDIVELKIFENCYLLKFDTLYSLVPIGIINNNKLKKGNNRLTEQKYLSIPYSFLGFLAGFIDGEGYIKITKTTKGYIQIKLEISLQLNDLSTIEYIYSVLNLGKIYISKDIRNPQCILIIKKTDLQEILFPLLLHYKIYFLTETRKNQFNTAMYILNNNIQLFKDIPDIKFIPTLFDDELPKFVPDYINLFYFKNWLVGFTVAEGSFVIKNNGEHSFQIKQNIHTNLFNAFKCLFNTKRNIYIEKKFYNQFSVSSRVDIQKVINFFSFSGLHPLVGKKNIQYLKWLESL